MKKTILLQVCILWVMASSIAQEQFDLVQYKAPKGWTKEVGNGSLSYIMIEPGTTNYAKIIMYRSIPGTGDLQKDFEAEWKDLVQTPYKTTEPPQVANAELQGGWKGKMGVSSFPYNNALSYVTLVTGSYGQTRISIVILTNTQKYMAVLEEFGNSLSFVDPPVSTPSTVSTPAAYTFTTSNFDDGWVAKVREDDVLVERGAYSVYLLYAVPYNADMFSGTGLRDAAYYWDNYVAKMFNVSSRQYNDGGSIGLKPPYMEGNATDMRTGKECFVGMYLLIVPNAVRIVIGTAPDEASFRRMYPKANDAFSSDLADMARYNKFAVAAADLVGQWQNGNTETAHWYYVSPAGYESYAGMTLAATSASFHFNGNGSYTSIHNGATGAVGNMSTFQQEFKGNYTVTNWTVTATNRFEGKTDRFDASFTAVRGGRILNLNNGAGLKYSLVRK